LLLGGGLTESCSTPRLREKMWIARSPSHPIESAAFGVGRLHPVVIVGELPETSSPEAAARVSAVR
jgi:hypothetical protein